MNKYDRTEFAGMGSGSQQAQSASGNDAISRQLRSFYDAVQEEAIPDHFLNLLERLSDAEQSHSPRGER